MRKIVARKNSHGLLTKHSDAINSRFAINNNLLVVDAERAAQAEHALADEFHGRDKFPEARVRGPRDKLNTWAAFAQREKQSLDIASGGYCSCSKRLNVDSTVQRKTLNSCQNVQGGTRHQTVLERAVREVNDLSSMAFGAVTATGGGRLRHSIA